MPTLDDSVLNPNENRLIMDEKNYKPHEQKKEYNRLFAKLTEEQRRVYQDIIYPFSKWLLDIGDGKINEPNDGEVEIEIPEYLLIIASEDPIHAIVHEIYGKSFAKENDPKFFKRRAILSPRNKYVDKINQYMLSQLPDVYYNCEERRYLSSDSTETSDTTVFDDMVYSQEFLNSINVSGLPKHELTLKKGAPIMLLRNIDPKGGLCNGTRLIVTQMANQVIEARIVIGNGINEKVLIPRIFVSPPDAKFPFRMRRRQFPVALSYSITITKSQGQTLEYVGLFLPKLVFTHGQLYVALSRVTTRKGLKILITNEDGTCQNKTLNVVFKEVFDNILL
ncbi:hypothetical protein CARUB_v10003947mg, partial [Capsella rubella]